MPLVTSEAIYMLPSLHHQAHTPDSAHLHQFHMYKRLDLSCQTRLSNRPACLLFFFFLNLSNCICWKALICFSQTKYLYFPSSARSYGSPALGEEKIFLLYMKSFLSQTVSQGLAGNSQQMGCVLPRILPCQEGKVSASDIIYVGLKYYCDNFSHINQHIGQQIYSTC